MLLENNQANRTEPGKVKEAIAIDVQDVNEIQHVHHHKSPFERAYKWN